MKTFTETMNMQFGEVSNAYIIKGTNLGFATFDTLCLICAELDIDPSVIDDSDFDSAVFVLDSFVKSANEETGYTISVWLD